jgi:hypothetical protein
MALLIVEQSRALPKKPVPKPSLQTRKNILYVLFLPKPDLGDLKSSKPKKSW